MTVGASRRTGRLRAAAAVLAVVAMACSSTAGEPAAGETAAAGVARGEVASLPSTSTSASAPEPRDPLSMSPSELSRDGTAPATVTASDEHGLERSLPTSDVPTAACPVPVAPGTPGVTDGEIAVGAPRLTNVTAMASGLERPDAELDEYVDAMVDHVNGTGGIACRQVRVVWHDVDVGSLAFGPASEQAMCATWTQDDEVFAAFPGGSNVPYDVLYTCLDRAGVAIIDVRGTSLRDRGGFDEVPRLIAVNSARLDRGTAEQVHALVRQGFLTTDARIGVLHYDAPRETRTVDGTLSSALAAHGLLLTERSAVATPVDASDLVARDRDVANAALRFKLADVDRVLFVRGSGLAAAFMEAAERNDYRPRYGLTTVELPVAALEVPAEQLVGARGLGWYPDLDLLPRRPESWPARSACLDFFHERGFQTATTVDRIFAVSVCEAFWFTRAAIEAAPRPLSADGVIAGARDLATSHESPTVQQTRFGPDRRDGAATYRDVAYDKDCGCFTYLGGPRPLR